MKYLTCIESEKVDTTDIHVQEVKFINTRGQQLPNEKNYAEMTLQERKDMYNAS
jgi:hypothetical protein